MRADQTIRASLPVEPSAKRNIDCRSPTFVFWQRQNFDGVETRPQNFERVGFGMVVENNNAQIRKLFRECRNGLDAFLRSVPVAR